MYTNYNNYTNKLLKEKSKFRLKHILWYYSLILLIRTPTYFNSVEQKWQSTRRDGRSCNSKSMDWAKSVLCH